jgi:hypothetical protein
MEHNGSDLRKTFSAMPCPVWQALAPHSDHSWGGRQKQHPNVSSSFLQRIKSL